MALIFIALGTSNAQGLLKKVANSMKDELLGTGKSGQGSGQMPEPACACAQPELILKLGGSLQLDYKEISINTLEDGSIVVFDRINRSYYIVKNGVTSGPIPPGDQRVAGLSEYDEDDTSQDALLSRNTKYIAKTGEKYTISFGGKTYGPYSAISSFTVSTSGDKFAAVVVENIPVGQDEGQKMDDAINKAKTDQEKMELAMQYAQQMQQKIMAGGGPEAMTPKLVTNVPDASFSPVMGGMLQGNWKYDEIVVSSYVSVLDLKGNTLLNLKPEFAGTDKLFINSTNTRYAAYNYGTLTFNDNTTLPDLFNPQLISSGGKTWLAYMYYSPKSNAIMQCRIEF